MRIGLFSDVHGNLEALNTVIERLQGESVDFYLCLGDIVGYGASPNECVEIVRQLPGLCVAGNHDYGAVEKTSIEDFNEIAKKAILWTRSVLQPENRAYLSSLPMTGVYDSFFLVHSTPKSPSEWRYLFGISDAEQEFSHFSTQICLVGHSHQPCVISKVLGDSASARMVSHTSFEISDAKRYMVNLGSIGQPRDRDPRACFSIYDTEKRRLEQYRLEYDIVSAQEQILKEGLPPFLAFRLAIGF